MTHTPELLPWPAGTTCPAEGYAEFAAALNQASHHYADDSGKEWGAASTCMERAAEIAVRAEWPYWTMKRMYAEIAPLPPFGSFMEVYCKGLRADRDALLEAVAMSTDRLMAGRKWIDPRTENNADRILAASLGSTCDFNRALITRIRGEG